VAFSPCWCSGTLPASWSALVNMSNILLDHNNLTGAFFEPEPLLASVHCNPVRMCCTTQSCIACNSRLETLGVVTRPMSGSHVGCSSSMVLFYCSYRILRRRACACAWVGHQSSLSCYLTKHNQRGWPIVLRIASRHACARCCLIAIRHGRPASHSISTISTCILPHID